MRIDRLIQEAFSANPAIPYTVRGVRAEGLSLRVTFESDAGNRLDLKIYPAGEAPTTCASTDHLDILFPTQGREALDDETRRDVEGVLDALAKLDLRPGYDDWQETLGPEADARFICGPSVEIKLTRRCNQQCIFCKSSARLENYATASEMPALLQRLARRADFVTFSGGETCLDPLLERHIDSARRAGFKGIEVQTNGMLLKDRQYVRRLSRAGMTNVLVSLHSHLPEVSDAITNLPGGFRETLKGIETLLGEHVRVVALCHVLCSLNYRHFPDFIRFLLDEFPGSGMTIVTSLAIPTHRVRHHPNLMPRLTDLAPPLVEGLALCQPPREPDMRDTLFDVIEHAAGAVGMMKRPLNRLLSAGKRTLGVRPLQARVIAHCGLPLCFLKEHENYHDESRSRGLLPAGSDLYHPEACGPCRWLDKCSGIWRLYASRYGEEEIRPVPGACRRNPSSAAAP